MDLEQRFDAFVNGYRDRAVRIAWRLLGGDAAAAEDVAQEAFVRAYRGLARFRDDAKLSTWFYRILVNEVRRHQRWRMRRERQADDREPDAVPDPAVRDAPRPTRRCAAGSARAIAALPRGQREAFVLVHLEGFTLVEAASATGRAVGTMKSHLHRALASLRDAARRSRAGGATPGDAMSDERTRIARSNAATRSSCAGSPRAIGRPSRAASARAAFRARSTRGSGGARSAGGGSAGAATAAAARRARAGCADRRRSLTTPSADAADDEALLALALPAESEDGSAAGRLSGDRGSVPRGRGGVARDATALGPARGAHSGPRCPRLRWRCAPGDRGHDRPGIERILERHAERLQLDDATREQIRALAEAEPGAERSRSARRCDRLRDEMHALLSADAPELDAVLAKADEIGRAETALKKERLRTMLAIRALLTTEQRRELVRIHEEFRAQRRSGDAADGAAGAAAASASNVAACSTTA